MNTRPQPMGVVIMALAVIQMLGFLIAASRRSYAALAIPIAAALAGLSALAFWIGWTMATTEADLEGLEFEEEFAASGAAPEAGE
ncbi:MAG: hypothetical protein EXR43_04035 [Dehalococcoidia bacterium]|nr:hypothetical protein [Dehalococcoidia bacterium]